MFRKDWLLVIKNRLPKVPLLSNFRPSVGLVFSLKLNLIAKFIIVQW